MIISPSLKVLGALAAGLGLCCYIDYLRDEPNNEMLEQCKLQETRLHDVNNDGIEDLVIFTDRVKPIILYGVADKTNQFYSFEKIRDAQLTAITNRYFPNKRYSKLEKESEEKR